MCLHKKPLDDKMLISVPGGSGYSGKQGCWNANPQEMFFQKKHLTLCTGICNGTSFVI